MPTLEELMAAGGKAAEDAPSPGVGKTLEELIAAGGKPAETPPPAAPSLLDRMIGAAGRGAKATGESFERLGSMAKRAIPAAIDLVSPISKTGGLQVPFHQLTDPAYRREAERGVSDVVTGGQAERLANFADPKFAASAQADAQAQPDARLGANLIGMALPSPFKRMSKGAAALVPGKGILAGGTRGVAAYEGAVTPMAALESGGDANAMFRAATDPASLVIGGGLGAAGGAINKVAGKVNNSRGAQARRFIEQKGQGATVSPTSAGKGGVFEGDLAGLPANDKGIGAAAKIGADKLISGIDAEFAAETKRPYQVMKNLIDGSPEAAKPRDVAPIVVKMQDAVHDLGTAPMVRSQLAEQLKILESYRDPTTEAVMLPENQLNALRRTLARSAKVGAGDVAGEKEAPLRAAYATAKAMVDEGPYAALNDFYAEGATKRQIDRTQLGLKKKPPADRGVDVRKAKLSLTRAGQNTATAGGDADVEAFKAANPGLAQYADLPELQRAKADLSFRLMPHHGGLMPRMAGAALGPGAALGAVAMGHGGVGLATGAAMMGLQNATPIAGRLLYPMTRGMDTATPRLAGRANPITLAAEQKRRRDAAMAAALSGGMQQ